MKISKRVIAYRPCSFCRHTLSPIVRVQSITDFNFLDVVHGLAKETAIADQFVFCANKNSELRWNIVAITGKNLFQKSGRLFEGEEAEREPHELRVAHQSREQIQILGSELSQFEALRLKQTNIDLN